MVAISLFLLIALQQLALRSLIVYSRLSLKWQQQYNMMLVIHTSHLK